MEDKTGGLGPTYRMDSLVEMPVYELKIGMFVVELDRPWLETPFAIQGFVLQHDSQIDDIAKYCKHVYVLREDMVQRKRKQNSNAAESTFEHLPQGGASRSIAHGERASRAIPKAIVRPGSAYVTVKPAEQEHVAAQAAYLMGKAAIKEIQNSVRDDHSINIELANKVVSDFVDSIVRNPDAMVWMSRIKNKTEYEVEHSLNVCVLAIVFGRHLNFDERELHTVGVCGLLHDIGDMNIQTDVLDNPGPLSDDQIKIMRSHTVGGYKLLTETQGVAPAVIDAALNHHEYQDGSGYPRGLTGDRISECAKIIAIVDAYDAMTSERCYASAVSTDAAQKILYECRGGQFDEEYTMEFMRAVGPYPPGTWVELHNGMVGVVLSANQRFRNLPVISLVLDGEKKATEEKMLDLFLTDSKELDKSYLIKNTMKDGTNGLWLKDLKLQKARQTA
jgi:HD-GYP domain-containing protein (c-di-GMP phosphodiesterase class II)